MEPIPYSRFRPYLVSAVSLFIIGCGIAAYAVLNMTPTVWGRWLFFFGGTLGLIGIAIPATWFLNLRFRSTPPAGVTVILRQAIWVGLYGALLAWLQQERLVSIWTGLGLAGGLIAIEYLIRMREKSRWQPNSSPPTTSAEQTPKDGTPPIQ